MEQGTHDDLESWFVDGRHFMTITKDNSAIQLRLPPDDARAVLTDIPGSSLLVRGETVLGVNIPLEAMNGMQANAVIRRAWKYGAPKRLAQVPELTSSLASDLPPSIGRPATRALNGAGIATIADLANHTEREIAALHGIGPKAIRILTDALSTAGLTWLD